MFKQYKLRNYKFILVMYVVILNVIGILLIGSAKPSVQSKQILGMIAGLTIMVMLSLIDYNFIPFPAFRIGKNFNYIIFRLLFYET